MKETVKGDNPPSVRPPGWGPLARARQLSAYAHTHTHTTHTHTHKPGRTGGLCIEELPLRSTRSVVNSLPPTGAEVPSLLTREDEFRCCDNPGPWVESLEVSPASWPVHIPVPFVHECSTPVSTHPDVNLMHGYNEPFMRELTSRPSAQPCGDGAFFVCCLCRGEAECRDTLAHPFCSVHATHAKSNCFSTPSSLFLCLLLSFSSFLCLFLSSSSSFLFLLFSIISPLPVLVFFFVNIIHRCLSSFLRATCRGAERQVTLVSVTSLITTPNCFNMWLHRVCSLSSKSGFRMYMLRGNSNSEILPI